MIRIENKKTYRGDGVYIGRSMPGIQGSLLGNPFQIGRKRTPEEANLLGNRFPAGRIRTREEAVEECRIWLWMKIQERGEVYAELTRLAELAKQGDLTLICWCKRPDRQIACHGDVIKRAVEYLNSIGG